MELIGTFRKEVTASERKSTDKFWSITRLTSVDLRFLSILIKKLKLGIGKVSRNDHVILGSLTLYVVMGSLPI